MLISPTPSRARMRALATGAPAFPATRFLASPRRPTHLLSCPMRPVKGGVPGRPRSTRLPGMTAVSLAVPLALAAAAGFRLETTARGRTSRSCSRRSSRSCRDRLLAGGSVGGSGEFARGVTSPPPIPASRPPHPDVSAILAEVPRVTMTVHRNIAPSAHRRASETASQSASRCSSTRWAVSSDPPRVCSFRRHARA